MFFLTVVYKNLLRRLVRSLLTVVGIAVGVGAVVALTSIAWGFQKSWEQAYSSRGTDLIVTKITSRSPLPEPFGEQIQGELLTLPHVQEASGLLTDMISIEDSPTVMVFGWQTKSFLWEHLKLVTGRWPAGEDDKVAVIGTIAAELLKKTIGSPVQIETGEFNVCGIFESSALVENGAIILPLRQLQEATDRQGKVNFLNLKLKPGTRPEDIDLLRATIKQRFPSYKAFAAGEVAQNNTAIQIAKAMSWATSIIALVVGAVGVTNTVLMSVFERTHEIGILLAIGWRRIRILRMILLESMFLSLIGGIVGIGFGFVAVKILQSTPFMRGKIEGDISASLLGAAILIALALGVLGGLYPAYRGSRLHPSEALRYE
ncbi:MAG: putative transport system permease protein [Verrucomicrobiota bacterium]